jgi:hypothetical protein
MEKQPATYSAPHEVYVGGLLYPPGAPFATAMPPGREWTKHHDAHAPVRTDAMTVAALRTHAATLGIDLGHARTRAAILALIHAAGNAG